jgi:hypothetical protein
LHKNSTKSLSLFSTALCNFVFPSLSKSLILYGFISLRTISFFDPGKLVSFLAFAIGIT